MYFLNYCLFFISLKCNLYFYWIFNWFVFFFFTLIVDWPVLDCVLNLFIETSILWILYIRTLELFSKVWALQYKQSLARFLTYSWQIINHSSIKDLKGLSTTCQIPELDSNSSYISTGLNNKINSYYVLYLNLLSTFY